MNLKHQIAEQQGHLSRLQQEVYGIQQKLVELRAQQQHCQHVFSKALPGYEHEGGTCEVCGINEVYAAHLNYRKAA